MSALRIDLLGDETSGYHFEINLGYGSVVSTSFKTPKATKAALIELVRCIQEDNFETFDLDTDGQCLRANVARVVIAPVNKVIHIVSTSNFNIEIVNYVKPPKKGQAIVVTPDGNVTVGAHSYKVWKKIVSPVGFDIYVVKSNGSTSKNSGKIRNARKPAGSHKA